MIIRLLKKISSYGVDNEFSRDLNRAITISNQISVLGFIICLLVFLLHGSIFGWDLATLTSGAIGLLFIVPLLANYWGWTLFSRIFISLNIPTSILAASVLSKIANINIASNFETHYYAYRFFIMIYGIAALVLYDQKNRGWSFFSVVYIALLLLLFDPLHNYFGVGFYQTGHTDQSYFFINIAVLLAFIGQVIGLYILRFGIEQNESDLLREIEERKRVETEIRQAKKMAEVASEAKSEFLANVSHEIRTPLNGVIGFSDLLIKTQLNESQSQYLGMLNKSAHYLLDIVNDVLDFSKMEAGKIELEIDKTNIHELCAQVTDAMRLQSQQKNLTLILTIAEKTPLFIAGDAVRLRQILINLVGNAIKFTHAGEVELSVKPIETANHQMTLHFSVRDTGIGIEPKDQKRIFEAFTQVDASSTKKYGGTGLGLTIANQLLKLMDSELHVISEIGKGSNFYFDLDLKKMELQTIVGSEVI